MAILAPTSPVSSSPGDWSTNGRPPPEDFQRHRGAATEIGGYEREFHFAKPGAFNKPDGLAHRLEVAGLLGTTRPSVGRLDIEPGRDISQQRFHKPSVSDANALPVYRESFDNVTIPKSSRSCLSVLVPSTCKDNDYSEVARSKPGSAGKFPLQRRLDFRITRSLESGPVEGGLNPLAVGGAEPELHRQAALANMRMFL